MIIFAYGCIFIIMSMIENPKIDDKNNSDKTIPYIEKNNRFIFTSRYYITIFIKQSQ